MSALRPAAVGSATVAVLSHTYACRYRAAMRSVEGGLLECCLQRRVRRRLLERDPFQCCVECGGCWLEVVEEDIKFYWTLLLLVVALEVVIIIIIFDELNERIKINKFVVGCCN